MRRKEFLRNIKSNQKLFFGIFSVEMLVLVNRIGSSDVKLCLSNDQIFMHHLYMNPFYGNE